MKRILLIGALALSCFAADTDLDGVPDNLDMCPNTPFLEIVNKNGCSASQLKKLNKNKIKYNISAGYEYDGIKNSKDAQTIFTSISAKKNNFKLLGYYSIYNDGYTNEYKSNDLILSLYYYNYSLSNTAIKLGIKSYLPTYYNDKTDYAFLIQGSYFFKNFSVDLSEKHKIYGESGTNAKDTITFDIGTTYQKLYISPYVYTENSAYNSSKWYKYAGITLYYPLNKKIGISLDSSMDLEESQNYSIVSSIDYTF